MSIKNWDSRTWHRNVAYFYFGLIISFAFSGIFLNHRRDWFPRDYIYETKEITVMMPDSSSAINKEFIDGLDEELGIEDYYKGHRIRDGILRVSYDNSTVEVDVNSGKGNLERFFAVPVLSQMTDLHLNTSNWWIYYSDLFGIGMILIAITGMFIQKGPNGFRQYGWKLAFAGIAFPLVFLFLLS